LEKRGFKHDQSPEAPVCRWTMGGTILDVMPTDHTILGFGNRWYTEAVRTASRAQLPSGRVIQLANPDFVEALPGHLPPDAASQARLQIIIDRLRQIAARHGHP